MIVGFFHCVMGLVSLLCFYESFDVSNQVNELLVLLIIVKRNDRNAVLQLIEVRIGSIVDQKYILKVPIF